MQALRFLRRTFVLVVVILISLLPGLVTGLPFSSPAVPVWAGSSEACCLREDIAGDGLVSIPDVEAAASQLGAESTPEGYDNRSALVKKSPSQAALAGYDAYAAARAEAQPSHLKAPGGISLLAAGGPDTFGYTYVDSDEPGGPTFSFTDISGFGTALGLGDDGSSNQSIGFTFNFYDTHYTQVAVSSNGYLNFDNGTGDFAAADFSNDCPIPNASAPNNAIYALWDDLDPGAGGEVYVYTHGSAPDRVFIVQYHNVPFLGSSVTVRFQVILVEGTNLILIQYDDVEGNDRASGSSATEGLEGPSSLPSGLSAVQYKNCNTAGNLHNGLAVWYKPPQIVNTTDDTDDGVCNTSHCSLREAINAANALPGKDMIKFNIPAATDSGCDAGTGVCTIQPTSALPAISGPVIVDGYSQPGADPATATTNADLKIVLDGSQAGDGVDGLVLVTDDSTVQGLVIHGFRVYDISNYGFIQGNGIVILGDSTYGGGDNNVIAGNFIGTDVTGTACVGNGGSGVLIGGPYSTDDTDNNTVGGTDPADRNVITCNGFQRDTSTPGPDDGAATGSDGVTIRANLEGSTFYSADGNQVIGNYIGTDVTGMTALVAGTQTFTFDSQTFDITYIGNTGNGVRIAGGSSNTVGGTTADERNIISGNEVAGVRIEAVPFNDPPTLTRAANNNMVQGNYIGTDVNGTGDLGNRDVGIYVVGLVDDADANQIGGTTGTTPGGSCSGACNLISGNGGGGVMILGGEADGNEVKGNYIGTAVNGASPIPNDGDGIAITDTEDNTIGGTTPEERNLISGNRGRGISILNNAKTWSPNWKVFLGAGEASGNIIQGNYIGTEVSGTAALSNTLTGVLIANAVDNRVGGTTDTTPGGPCTGACNLISGNGENGVLIMTTGGAAGNVETSVVTAEGTANGNPVKGSDSATVTVGGTSWLEVAKMADPTHLAQPGGTVTFTIGITNSGVLDVVIKRLSDSSYGNLNGQGTCAVPQSLAPGLAYTCAFSTTVTGVTGDSATDTVTASGTDENGDFVINSDSATVHITDLPPAIVVTKTVDSPVVAPTGGTATFTVAVKNISGSPMTIDELWDTKHGDLNGQGTCAVPQVLADDSSYTCSFSATVSGATGNTIESNFIGTDVGGDAAVPNQGAGVVIIDAPDNAIGGATAAQGNVISGNAREGVVVLGVGATGNSLRHNLIGTQADGASVLGNGSHGVSLAGDPSDNAIGEGSVGNTIAYNGGDGLVAFSGTGNQMLDNSIFDNTELGIDLGDDNDVTANDDTDPDTGANNLQNYPVLTSASVNGNTTIAGRLNSAPNTQFTIQFFANATCDPSGFGEGRTYLATDTPATDGSGYVTTSATVVGDLTGQFITATATDPYGNTSEFSNCIPVPSAPVLTINKEVQDLNSGSAEAGDTLRYTISYTNTGNASATGVFITDIYSTFCVTRTNITNGDFPDHDDDATRLRWPIAGGIVLDAQASGSVRYDCTLQDTFPNGTSDVINTSTIDSDQTDPDCTGETPSEEDSSDGCDQEQMSVTAAPMLTIDKECTPATGNSPGDTVHCVIQYANTGAADATGVTIVDDYAQSKGSVSSITGSAHFAAGTDNSSTITWGPSTIPAGESGQVEYEYILAGAGTFPYGTTQVTNTGTIDSNEAGPEQDTEVLSTVVCFDFDGNGVVDVGDVTEVAIRWRLTAVNPDPDSDAATPNYEARFDNDGDGMITIRDILAVADKLSLAQTCP